MIWFTELFMSGSVRTLNRTTGLSRPAWEPGMESGFWVRVLTLSLQWPPLFGLARSLLLRLSWNANPSASIFKSHSGRSDSIQADL